MKQRGVTHQSLERGLKLVETIALSPSPLGLAEVTRRIGLHRSTAHHLLQTLVGLGYLRQDAESRGYQLAAKPFQIVRRMWSAQQLGEIAQPYLESLSRETDEGTSLAAWLDGTVRIVAKREADAPVRVVQDVGGERPIHCTAVGKALAAWLPPAELRAALARTRMTRLTPKTITTPRAFEAELRRIRAVGYAVDDEEQFTGLRCVAMPVFTYTGQVFASMCVLGPKHRMTHQKLAAVRAPLAEHSRRLSARLGAS